MRAEDFVDDGALRAAGGEANCVIAVIDGEDSFISVAPGADLCCCRAVMKVRFGVSICRMNCEHLSPQYRVECLKHCEEVAGTGRTLLIYGSGL